MYLEMTADLEEKGKLRGIPGVHYCNSNVEFHSLKVMSLFTC